MKKFIKYVLLQNNNILVEHRQADAGHDDAATLIPGGGIESFDEKEGKDPREVALFREVREELNGQVTIEKYVYLDEIVIPERQFLFSIYLITDWHGTIPEHIYENGIIDGTLEWVDKDVLLSETQGRVNKFILERVNEYLHKE